ncbi:hypothetical protein Q7C36_021292 [Tachysurus vachellii]|uniref:Uncharacterized protein n=1 Tax=Tachysurus vachellii TaxID=175792 RepID=A0AA88LQ49_TACVA|nr:hypothetical protein Q7C36_021292 [Tachysurus vachellii]
MHFPLARVIPSQLLRVFVCRLHTRRIQCDLKGTPVQHAAPETIAGLETRVVPQVEPETIAELAARVVLQVETESRAELEARVVPQVEPETIAELAARVVLEVLQTYN